MTRISSTLRLTAAIAMLLSLLAAQALDLPVKRVKGKQYFYHKVKKGESLYGISKNLGLTVEEIVRNNPALADGVKKGDLLVFPYDEYKDPEPAEEDSIAVQEILAVDTVEVREQVPAIGVLLPFGLGKTELTARNKLALDFYRGLLVAADSLSGRPGDIVITAHDTDSLDAAGIERLIAADSLLAGARVIIGPDDEKILNAIANAAAANGTYTLNVLNTRDSSYLTNSHMLQANVPQRTMYKLAVDALRSEFPLHRPVILHNSGGNNDREAFTAYLTERYREEGIEPIVIEYNTTLVAADLETLPVAAGEKYVVIPSGASVVEFNRFAYTLRNYRDKLKAREFEPLADGTIPDAVAEVAVFGYPDWTAFRGEALELLHRLDATVYSRFFDNPEDFNARGVAAAFQRWYGTTFIESVPVYALLGYDCGTYLIKNLRRNDGSFEATGAMPYSGVQSTFDFERCGEGYANNALYIISYGAGGRLSARVQ